MGGSERHLSSRKGQGRPSAAGLVLKSSQLAPQQIPGLRGASIPPPLAPCPVGTGPPLPAVAWPGPLQSSQVK